MDIKSETRSRIDGYTKMLNDLMQQYRDRAVRDIHTDMHHVVEQVDLIHGDLSLEGMAYARGAGAIKTKKCLDGTRIETLAEIVGWIQNTDENVPRILWLHGQAGRGKSAIAHTLALWLKDAGGFGSCFCFARDRQAEHREEKIFTTIARDLADHEPAFRRALADVLAKDHSLKTTSDVTEQWEKLILEPLLKVSSTMIGNMVVVIDALDESGPVGSRTHILSVLASKANNLPRNIRIFVTSRPLPDIQHALGSAPHVKVTCLDDVSTESTERDILLYVSKKLGRLPDIGDTEVQKISRKADSLFEWARLACDYIQPNTAFGATVKERYDEVVSLQSEEGRSLLDVTYKAILETAVPKSGKGLERYRSVMHQVLMTFEPLSIAALNGMRKRLPKEHDHYDVFVVLKFMSSVLGGTLDYTSPVRPLHASFYDFLTDRSRSGIYFIDTSCPGDLAVSTLQILHDGLRFNICGLESSYLSNSEVADLPDRITKSIPPHLSYSCRFWSQHLEKTVFNVPLAQLVEDFVGSEKFLFWLEAMSLLSRVGNAAIALISAAKWLLNQGDFKETLELVEDGVRFIDIFHGGISHSAPHVVVGSLEHWNSAQLLGLEGHTNAVWSVAFSPDGKRIVSGSGDETVRVWDAERGVQIGSHLEGHTDRVISVAFSPDGKRIVSGSWDKTVRVWDAERGIQIGSHLEGHMDGVNSIAISTDGKRIVSGSEDNMVKAWDVNVCEDNINGPVPPDPADVIIPSHICFSSISSHALCDDEQLFDGPSWEGGESQTQSVKLYHDGWIRGPKCRLLLWIPVSVRHPLYSMWTTAVIPKGCCIELDLSKMVHGPKWHQCYKPVL
ncbi:hypothetical protein PISMIDRAFT_606419 [Pisolithus microcarpus 441]|uniref:NACHT domain-containing protein n=1 Tax=Pisolithus microcarpus 441 TaxID=765257 RepID=A0A0D0A7X2_9AGAM|nr:hypothetical protein PISMIDRAFT_606419 [Pisolithus microcarpus 441]